MPPRPQTAPHRRRGDPDIHRAPRRTHHPRRPARKPPCGPLRAFSFGGGWQSVAALVLAARGDLDFDTFLFANVGDDSENPATLTYLRRHAIPYAKAHNLTIRELRRIRRDGSIETLYGRLTREGSRSIPIPVRMSNGAPGTRSCTADFKIRVIGRWLKAHGATATNPPPSASASASTRSTAPTPAAPNPTNASSTRYSTSASAAPTAPASSAPSACPSRPRAPAGSAPSTASPPGRTCAAITPPCSPEPATWKPSSTPAEPPSAKTPSTSPATTPPSPPPSPTPTPSPSATTPKAPATPAGASPDPPIKQARSHREHHEPR